MTIKEIAELAGVSKSTVSRVLNNSGYVNDETRKKIEDVIKKNNYFPSASARNLSKRETNTIGVVIPEFNNSFFGDVLRGITEIVDENDLSLFYCDTNNNAAKEEKALQMLKHQRVRGVIITPAIDYTEPNASKKLRNMLNNLNVPVVVVDREIENSQWDGVFYENYQSAYCATEVLAKEGHKRIGIITGDLQLKIGRDRFDGFKQALEDYEIKLDKKDIYLGDFTIEKAYCVAKKMFDSGDYPNAIFTSNNNTTLGLIKAARECGITLGKDIGTIGIDHVNILDILGYNFSYVTRDTEEMGRVAMRMLLERLKYPNKERKICIMPYQLVVKGSEKSSY